MASEWQDAVLVKAQWSGTDLFECIDQLASIVMMETETARRSRHRDPSVYAEHRVRAL